MCKTRATAPLLMILTSGSSFGLLPLGLALFAVLALPPVLGARVGAWLRLRATVMTGNARVAD